MGDGHKQIFERHGSLTKAYERARKLHKVPVTLPDGSKVDLSPGVHNELQRLIVEEFAPRFAPGAVVVYLGDTALGIGSLDRRLSGPHDPLQWRQISRAVSATR